MKAFSGWLRLLFHVSWCSLSGVLASCPGDTTAKLYFDLGHNDPLQITDINWYFYSARDYMTIAFWNKVGFGVSHYSYFQEGNSGRERRLIQVSASGRDMVNLYFKTLRTEDAGVYGCVIVIRNEYVALKNFTLETYMGAKTSPVTLFHRMSFEQDGRHTCTCRGLAVHGATRLALYSQVSGISIATSYTYMLTYTFDELDPPGHYRCYLQGDGAACTDVSWEGTCLWTEQLQCKTVSFVMVILLALFISTASFLSVCLPYATDKLVLKTRRYVCHKDLILVDTAVFLFTFTILTIGVSFGACDDAALESGVYYATLALVVVAFATTYVVVAAFFCYMRRGFRVEALKDLSPEVYMGPDVSQIGKHREDQVSKADYQHQMPQPEGLQPPRTDSKLLASVIPVTAVDSTANTENAEATLIHLELAKEKGGDESRESLEEGFAEKDTDLDKPAVASKEPALIEGTDKADSLANPTTDEE